MKHLLDLWTESDLCLVLISILLHKVQYRLYGEALAQYTKIQNPILILVEFSVPLNLIVVLIPCLLFGDDNTLDYCTLNITVSLIGYLENKPTSSFQVSENRTRTNETAFQVSKNRAGTIGKSFQVSENNRNY